MYSHTYINTYIHTYVHTYIHTYTCVKVTQDEAFRLEDIIAAKNSSDSNIMRKIHWTTNDQDSSHKEYIWEVRHTYMQYIHTYSISKYEYIHTVHATTFILLYIRVIVHNSLQTHIHTYIHTYIHTCMHTCIHTYIYLYKYLFCLF